MNINHPLVAHAAGNTEGEPAHTLDRAAPQNLINALGPVVSKMAFNLAHGDFHRAEDYRQEAAIAICAAVETHDPGKGNLEHYATKCAHRRILNCRRWNVRREREIPVDFAAENNGEEPESVALEAKRQLALQSISTRVSEGVDIKQIWAVAEVVLTKNEFLVIHMLYKMGMTPGAAAQVMHVSAPRITQLSKAGIAKLRAALVGRCN